MSQTTDVMVKPVRSFIIRPMGDGASSALVFETSAGRTGYRVANADVGKLIALVIAELAKLPPDQAAKAAEGGLPAPLELRGLEVSEGRNDSEVQLTADFGAVVLPMAIDRNRLAKALTEFLRIAGKLED
jgi:hypothetical protein